MLKRRKQQLLMIVALVVGIASLSIGFAAFSATLNISSSATVTPDSSSFSVVFSGSADDPYDTLIEPIDYSDSFNAAVAEIAGNSITNMNINFGSSYSYGTYEFYVHNTGQYPAYLNSIDFGNGKVCENLGDVSPVLVEAACEDISVSFYSDFIELFNPTSLYELGGHVLNPGESTFISINFSYGAYNLPDGDLKVNFDDIVLNYSSVDSSNEISFTLFGKTYSAKENMLWGDWVESEYNIDNYYFHPAYYCIRYDEDRCALAREYEKIMPNLNYNAVECWLC